MKKIIKLDSSSGTGGGQKVMFDVVTGLMNEFDFLIASPRGLFSKKYSEINLEFRELTGRWPVLQIRRIIKNESPDILHAHGTRAAFYGRMAVIGLKKRPKVIYTLHGLHIIYRKNIFLRWLLITLERFLNRWTDILVCVSESDKNLVLIHNTINPERIVVIKNGISLEDYKADISLVESTKKELHVEDRFVLISIGRLHPQKDFSTLLKALKLLTSENQNVRLLIVGDGPLRESLEKEAIDLGLNDYVKFLGFRNDIQVLINLSDVMILSTNWEAFGLVCIEAGACKKPIIASDVDGVREAVVDNRTGYLARKGSPEDLAEKITKLIASRELREDMGKAGYEFVSKNFNKKRMVDEYGALYRFI